VAGGATAARGDAAVAAAAAAALRRAAATAGEVPAATAAAAVEALRRPQAAGVVTVSERASSGHSVPPGFTAPSVAADIRAVASSAVVRTMSMAGARSSSSFSLWSPPPIPHVVPPRVASTVAVAAPYHGPNSSAARSTLVHVHARPPANPLLANNDAAPIAAALRTDVRTLASTLGVREMLRAPADATRRYAAAAPAASPGQHTTAQLLPRRRHRWWQPRSAGCLPRRR